MNTNELSAFTEQCQECDYWHVFMNWQPTSCAYTEEMIEGDLWYVPTMVWDTLQEAIAWIDAQADKLEVFH